MGYIDTQRQVTSFLYVSSVFAESFFIVAGLDLLKSWKLIGSIRVFDNVSQHGNETIRQMCFTFLFDDFPHHATVAVKSRVDGEQVSIFPKYFIRRDNR